MHLLPHGEFAVMASGLRDLELIMDNNVKLVFSATSPASTGCALPSPASEEGESPAPEDHAVALQHHRDQSVFPNSRPSLLASLSLAFAPVLPFNPTPSRPVALPANSAASSSAVKLPSLKKCINPTPVMPALSASTTSLDQGMAGSIAISAGSKKAFSSAFPDYLRLPERNNSYANFNDGGAMRKASIVWFRNDLRCHDNDALVTASKDSLSLLPVYVFDPREFGKSSTGFDKTGSHRARFLLQCVSYLREGLRELGSDLVIRIGKPEDVLLSLAKAIGADALYAHQDILYEGIQSEKKVQATLQEEGIDTKYFWGNTLLHVDDLPFKIEDLPTTYSAFYEKVDKLSLRDTIETPKQLKGFPIRGSIKPGDMPTLEELSIKSVSSSSKGASGIATPLIGGEKEALNGLDRLVADFAGQLNNKTNTKANLQGSTFSSKISPWLSVGCLSPRHALERFRCQLNSKGTKSLSELNSTQHAQNWLVYELLWRDFFRFVSKKQSGSRLLAEASKGAAVAYA